MKNKNEDKKFKRDVFVISLFAIFMIAAFTMLSVSIIKSSKEANVKPTHPTYSVELFIDEEYGYNYWILFDQYGNPVNMVPRIGEDGKIHQGVDIKE